MNELHRTVFCDRHRALGAAMVEFAGWEMPIQYPSGIVEEHLATRKEAGFHARSRYLEGCDLQRLGE
ncbi:MAG: hypothetical protein R6V46_14315 [Desulfatiglandaceae bacterium]